jgi:hypothetical protein
LETLVYFEATLSNRRANAFSWLSENLVLDINGDLSCCPKDQVISERISEAAQV